MFCFTFFNQKIEMPLPPPLAQGGGGGVDVERKKGVFCLLPPPLPDEQNKNSGATIL